MSVFLTNSGFEERRLSMSLASPSPDGSWHLAPNWVDVSLLERWVPLPGGGWSLAPD